MLKWQIRQRKKAHESIIQNAKPTIKIQDLLKTHHNPQPILHRTKSPLITPPRQPKHNLTSFTKILQLFNLQQYSSLLIDNGFPFKLGQKKSMKFIDDILDKVLQKDQEKFLALMNTLVMMSKDMINGIGSKKVVKLNFDKIEKNSRITQYPPPSVQRSHKNIIKSNRTQKNTQLFKVRQTTTFKSPILPSQKTSVSSKLSLNKSKSISNKSKSKQLSSERQVIVNNQISSQTLRKIPQLHTNRTAKDDIYITHNFRNSLHAEPTLITQKNKIISRLIQKLNNSRESTTKQADINLQLQKIKKMYLSFDSVRLTSNIGNIDLEEMIDCFVEEMYVKIEHEKVNEKVNVRRNKRIFNGKMWKQGKVNSQKYIEFDTNKEEIEFLLKESLIFESQQQMIMPNNPQSATKLDYMHDPISTQDLIEQNPLLLNDNTSQTRSLSVDLQSENPSIQSSDFDDLEICDSRQSFMIQDNFACFDNNNNAYHFSTNVQRQDIKNFIQLVMMAGKTEKEIILIAYIYVRRLLMDDGIESGGKKRLTMHNWRNILLVTLISASKIWDDTSLENHSFSKVLTSYTTYEINRLEKHFLFLINYKLTIQQQEYCQGYFELRRHLTKANKTAHLMSLDIKTVLRLEEKKAGVRQKEVHLKEYYRKKMDKSF